MEAPRLFIAVVVFYAVVRVPPGRVELHNRCHVSCLRMGPQVPKLFGGVNLLARRPPPPSCLPPPPPRGH